MTIRLRNKIQLILTVLMVVMHGAVYWSAFVGESYVALGTVLGIVLIISARYKIGIPKWYLIYFSTTLLCYIISALFNGIGLSKGLNIKTALIIDLNLLITLVIYRIDKTSAIRQFIKIVVFISAVSLIFYAIQSFFSRNAISNMFTYLDWGRGHYANILYTYAAKDTRNYGVFYEPGVYQILINSALYFMIFEKNHNYLKETQRIRYIVILIITLLTTGSTTGYLNIAYIVIGMFLMKGKSKAERNIGIIFFAAIIGLSVDYVINSETSIIQSFVLDKLFAMQNSGGHNTYTSSSGGARLFMIDMAIQALKENPLFGIGAERVNLAVAQTFWEGFGTGNGLFSLIATKGIITTLATIGPILYMGYKNKSSWQAYLVFLLMFFNTTIAQSSFSIGSPSFFLIVILELPNLLPNVELDTPDNRRLASKLNRENYLYIN